MTSAVGKVGIISILISVILFVISAPIMNLIYYERNDENKDYWNLIRGLTDLQRLAPIGGLLQGFYFSQLAFAEGVPVQVKFKIFDSAL